LGLVRPVTRGHTCSPTVTSRAQRGGQRCARQAGRQEKEDVLTDWRETARCKEMDPDLFFPVGTTGPALLQIEAAKAVCRQCDVRQECLQYALDSNQEYGIWGGLTEEERRYMRRELTARIAR
jgi:WhiB family transcriptional regulator, redox-sensing transcriptional regulator